MIQDEMHWTQFNPAKRTFQFWLDDWRRTFGADEYYWAGHKGDKKVTLRDAADVIAIPVRVFLR